MKIPLPAVLDQNVVDVHFDPADQWAWIRHGAHHTLVENRGGIDLTARPGPGLPGPPVARRARAPDNAIGGGPLARFDTAVDAGALYAEHCGHLLLAQDPQVWPDLAAFLQPA